VLPDEAYSRWPETAGTPEEPGGLERRQDDSPGGLPRALRPREKLFARGPERLAQRELVTLVLGSGTRRECVTRIARRLVGRHGLKGLAELTPEAWRSQQGLGLAAAARMCAVFEIGRRLYEGADEERPRIGSPAQAYRELRHLARARKEQLVGLYLDAQNGLLARETISVGSLNTTRTHPREILFPAIAQLAMGFVLAHNHPSGSLEPSPEDLEFTQSIRRAAELVGFELYDHLIVSSRGYTSLKERGLL
jgi:DNA repair protein RadC